MAITNSINYPINSGSMRTGFWMILNKLITVNALAKLISPPNPIKDMNDTDCKSRGKKYKPEIIQMLNRSPFLRIESSAFLRSKISP